MKYSIFNVYYKIIKSSRDKTIKLWEEINECYQCITIIKLSFCIKSLLILKNKNLFVINLALQPICSQEKGNSKFSAICIVFS